MSPDPTSFAQVFETWAFIEFGDHGPARLYGFTAFDIEQRRPMGMGDPRKVLAHAVPARGLVALGYTVMGWCAPLQPAVRYRPSEHPERRRMRNSVMVTSATEMISVVRYFDDGEVAVLSGGLGAIPELLASVWLRRPETHAA